MSSCASGCGWAGPLIRAINARSLSSRQPAGNVQNRRIIISFSAIRDLRGSVPSPSAISISRTRHLFPCSSATSRDAPCRSIVVTEVSTRFGKEWSGSAQGGYQTRPRWLCAWKFQGNSQFVALRNMSHVDENSRGITMIRISRCCTTYLSPGRRAARQQGRLRTSVRTSFSVTSWLVYNP